MILGKPSLAADVRVRMPSALHTAVKDPSVSDLLACLGTTPQSKAVAPIWLRGYMLSKLRGRARLWLQS